MNDTITRRLVFFLEFMQQEQAAEETFDSELFFKNSLYKKSKI